MRSLDEVYNDFMKEFMAKRRRQSVVVHLDRVTAPVEAIQWGRFYGYGEADECTCDDCSKTPVEPQRHECVCPRCTERIRPDEYTYPECVRCFSGCGH